MTVSLDIAAIAPDFPHYRVALVIATGLAIRPARPAALGVEVAAIEAALSARHGETPTGEIEAIRVWRAAYRAFGIKRTSYRCSVERLIRSIQAGRGLPRINGFVDWYNAVSAKHILPAGADDLDKLHGGLAFRYAREGDSFIALGDESRAENPPKPGEVVYTDAEKVLCRRWNWYQDGRSATTLATTRAVLTVQALGGGPDLEAAVAELCDGLARHCGGRCTAAIASAATPRVELDEP